MGRGNSSEGEGAERGGARAPRCQGRPAFAADKDGARHVRGRAGGGRPPRAGGGRRWWGAGRGEATAAAAAAGGGGGGGSSSSSSSSSSSNNNTLLLRVLSGGSVIVAGHQLMCPSVGRSRWSRWQSLPRRAARHAQRPPPQPTRFDHHRLLTIDCHHISAAGLPGPRGARSTPHVCGRAGAHNAHAMAPLPAAPQTSASFCMVTSTCEMDAACPISTG